MLVSLNVRDWFASCALNSAMPFDCPNLGDAFKEIFQALMNSGREDAYKFKLKVFNLLAWYENPPPIPAKTESSK